MLKFKIFEKNAGDKLIDFLSNELGTRFSNREIKRQIECNCCLINGTMERFASRRLEKGDQIQFDDRGLRTEQKQLVFDPRRVLFEDEHLLVYDKPSGITSDEKGILKLLRAHFPKLMLTHRLDKETTGIIVLAKDAETEEKMMDAFRNRAVHKEYIALVDGAPKHLEGRIENELGKVRTYQGQAIYGKVPKGKGLSAVTEWKLKKISKPAALLLCLPETGRTHQIRAHLSEMGHPILGDYQYGRSFRCTYRPSRMLLHASRISFLHPHTQAVVELEAPQPKDFTHAIHALW